jgi:transposase
MTILKTIKYHAIVHYEYFEHSLRGVSKKYGVSKSVLAKWLKEKSCCRSDKQTPRKRSGISLADSIKGAVADQVEKDPYVCASELCSHVARIMGKSVSLSTMYRTLHANRFTFKRAQRCPRGVPPHEHPFLKSQEPYNDAISIDECHFYTSDRRRRGWGRRGERVPKEPLRGRTSTTLLLAIDRGGVVGFF